MPDNQQASNPQTDSETETQARDSAPSSETRQAALAAANTVTVWPGNKSFQTIGAALASITDASLKKQYELVVGPGTYSEKVQMKPYVTISGAGQDVTHITQPPSTEANGGGTVMAASNCTLDNVTVSSLGGMFGSYSTAVSCSGAVNFRLDNSTLIVDDQNQQGLNQCTLAASFYTTESVSQIIVSYCTIKCTAQNSDSGAIALGIAASSKAELLNCKVVATDHGGQSFAVITANEGNVILDNCYIQGTVWALYNSDLSAPITANNCQINGQVSNGVTVNNNPPPGNE